MNQKIAILGGGLVGPLLSILLAKKGFQVAVFEKRGNPLETKADSGRSINLALSHRGIHSLKMAGVLDRVNPLLIPMMGRKIHAVDGETSFQSYGTKGQFINSVSRSALNQLLVKEAIQAGVHFHFNNEIHNIDHQQTTITSTDGHQHAFDAIFGADGAFSSLRSHFTQSVGHFDTTVEALGYGYKELCIPPMGNDFALDPNALHIWPRNSLMLITLPNMDKSFTCTLFISLEGTDSFDSLRSDEQVLQFFRSQFPDVIRFIPDLIDQFNTNPTSSLFTIRSFPWSIGNCLLIGDAAHAIVPFYGQGMNAGFEDCRLLMEVAEAHNFNWEKIFKIFQDQRKPDTDAIATLALQNFVEMRDKVLDDQFQKQKVLEARLHHDFPDQWTPLYSMVTFSDIPYQKALEAGRAQQKVIDSLGKDYDPMAIDTAKVMRMFGSLK